MVNFLTTWTKLNVNKLNTKSGYEWCTIIKRETRKQSYGMGLALTAPTPINHKLPFTYHITHSITKPNTLYM